MNILGLKVSPTHDNGASIIFGDRVVAISEERLNREKHTKKFPYLSIKYCLQEAGMENINDVDLIVCDTFGDAQPQRNIWRILKNSGLGIDFKKLHVINHHDVHAVSAYFCSPFNEAAVIICDGAGTWHATQFGKYGAESESIYYAQDNQIHLISRNLQPRERYRFLPPTSISIGKLYEYITAVCRLGRHGEGKTMGLAPYGTGRLTRMYPKDHWAIFQDGRIFCNPGIYPLCYFGRNNSKFLKNGLHSRRNEFFFLIRGLLNRIFKGYVSPSLFNLEIGKELSDYYKEIDINSFDFFKELAFTVQKILEEMTLELAKYVYNITQVPNLCIAGGVGLNSVVNKKILDATPFNNVWIQPASSDTGIPLGCALYGKHVIMGHPKNFVMRNAYLGRHYKEEEILKALRGHNYTISTDIIGETAELLVQGKTVGWFQGASEYGPRALGNRSIICDPRRPEMKDILNAKVKHREPFRPFAPSVLVERSREYFDLNCESPFMLLVANVKEDKIQEIPAITHVDGTARIQTVSREENPIYYDLIDRFAQLTGVSLILNTSFNIAGDPIVETPEDAIQCFLNTQLDCLVIGNYLLKK